MKGSDPGRTGKKLACQFVGHEQKAEKYPYSPSLSRPLDTARVR